jgi:hypothetical protein
VGFSLGVLSEAVFLPAVVVCIAVGYLSGRVRAIALAALLPIGITLLALADGAVPEIEFVLSVAVWSGAIGAASIAAGIALGQVPGFRGNARNLVIAAAYVALWAMIAEWIQAAFVIAFLGGVPVGYAIGRWWAVGLGLAPLLTIVPTDSPAFGLVGVPYAAMAAGLIAAGVAYRRSSATPAERAHGQPRRDVVVGTRVPMAPFFGGLMAVVAVASLIFAVLAADPGCTEGPCGDDFILILGFRAEAAIAVMWIVAAIATPRAGQAR